VLTVVVALALSVPAGYALARLKLPVRSLFMIVFLLPQAFPSVAIYINVARIFYNLGINGTVLGVVLVHAAHGLVYSVWIAAAAFAAVDKDLELAARNIGASPLRTFFTVTLPRAAPGVIASGIFVFRQDHWTSSPARSSSMKYRKSRRCHGCHCHNAAMGGNYQKVAPRSRPLILLVPSVLFMLFSSGAARGRSGESGGCGRLACE
jgi:ABC-type anion transport system duplicated permease subunit